MQYRKTKFGNLSCLGLGCMRLPKDDSLAEAIVVKAIEGGINYLDTAYIYGDNEERLGRILTKNNLRDKIYLATKLPLLMLRKPEDFDSFFNTELKRLQTDHIDFYLLHMLSDVTFWQRLVDWGIVEWLREKQASGVIRQVGFSFHGTGEDFLKLLPVYPWQFCLIQYNYIDEFNQAGVNGLKQATNLGIPVMIMEPLLGGRLANNLPEEASGILHEHALEPARFGLNWIWNQPEPVVVLSGMNTLEQLEQNLVWADEARVGMLSQADLQLYRQVKDAFIAADKIHCTGCNYCMPCPYHVHIPSCFKSYNLSYSSGFYAGFHNYIKELGITSANFGSAGSCRGCGKCEKHCPQKLPIRENLKKVEQRLEPFWFKIGVKIARKIMKRG